MAPPERMKMRAPDIVPSSTQALAVPEELKTLTGEGQFLFPSQSKLTVPMSENTMLSAIYRMDYHLRATSHGFRATVLHDLE